MLSSLWGGEEAAGHDAFFELSNGNAVLWIGIKNHAKDINQLIRQWQYCLQIPVVPGEGIIGWILRGGSLPWIATTSEVDKNYTQGPDVVRRASV